MKRILSLITVAAAMAVSCNQKPRTDAVTTTQPTPAYTDTVGLSQFQQWKIQHELNNDNTQNLVSTQPVRTTTTRKTTTRRYSSGGSMNSSSSNTARSSRKGWSSAAKGATIGGVGGAVIGAVINKRNRVVGGVVGGVLGAGAGYGIGRHIDKKNGRY